jgi:uncharacterized surface protein with fasciclin (FAS1) repeats
MNRSLRFSAVAGLAALALSAPSTASAQTADRDIVETAVAAGSFTTLATALEAAGLVDVLKGEGPFTVFAPTDEAFAALPAGTLEALLADREKLVAVLTYHVVSGRVTSAQVANLSEATTVNGAKVEIMTHDGSVMINDANVVAADVNASNGVIHVLDKVILPPAAY